MNEWALLIFTVCMQAAIGGTIMLAIFYKKISETGEEQTFLVMKMPLVVFAGLSLVGLGASFAHLGAPENALNAIRHLGSSWMSREILATGLFIGAISVTTVLGFVQKKVNLWLLLIASIIGIVDIFFMGAIYANSLVSGWNSINTYTSFIGTAIVLGPVLAASLIVPILRKKENQTLAQHFVKYSFSISILGIAVQLVGLALFPTVVPEVNMIAGTNAIATLEGYQGTVALRWIIEVIGVGLLGYLSISKNKKVSLSFAYIALAAIFLAEGMSRYMFFVLGS
ncbi:dimethyl sulfoxide reductase anchor subunit family protein [Cytobacillus dafuensis]|uniref:Cyclic nucleotide-binding protein n=1 Tax=Cytobacillus dafuensis TaxID=1742359 RepID=A0A5B8Z933_CYTDA|nr:DmsC/YnfH family molybdoenzyme membrane anchor subunit [Cytobacillus dafuensis]QED49460.1 cyclic nucleotide-binding protein [Cytobacillus dafuensis]